MSSVFIMHNNGFVCLEMFFDSTVRIGKYLNTILHKTFYATPTFYFNTFKYIHITHSWNACEIYYYENMAFQKC